ncbi:hypothetical protein WJX73_000232 [Symbiochloris irregularis]|uniref:BRCA1-associated protein n=1 Tax=Symbiochloris irregularis TaxID=706552 RepID=A0AAW1Q156_9CHLO
MYAVKLDSVAGSSSTLVEDEEPRPESSGAGNSDLPTTTSELETDTIGFTAGNPRVEHLTGVVHLYRCLPISSRGGQRTETDSADGETPPPSLPEERGLCICVLALPLDLGVSEFCKFLGGHTEHIRHVRLMRQKGAHSACLALLTFSGQSSADAFYLAFNLKPYSSLEPQEVCHLVFVKDVQIASDDDTSLPSPGQRELPTCPVCLERLDEDASGLVTTVCNHEFHNECLQRWSDTSCPVCRYVANDAPSASRCSCCGTSEDLWICLICGHIGCGRYRERHAVDHWRDTEHAYALELHSQRVWDYVSDGYVHRLIQSKTDGKLVEVPSPAQASHANRGAADQGPNGAPEVDRCGSMGAQGGDAGLSSKLDAITVEYNHLLVSQLDSQRGYFEGLLHKQAAAHEAELAAALTAGGEADSALRHQHTAVHLADQGRKTAEKKAAEAAARLQKAQREVQDLRSLNEQVMRNQASLKQARDASVASASAAELRIKDLEEQVRDLMIFIEAQRTISSSEELASGAASVPAPNPAAARKARSSKRK